MLKVSDIPGTEVLMLPLAYSTGTILNAILQWYSSDGFHERGVFYHYHLFQSLGALLFLGLVTYLFKYSFTNFWHYHILGNIFTRIYFLNFGHSSRHCCLASLENKELESIRETFKQSSESQNRRSSPREDSKLVNLLCRQVFRALKYISFFW